MKKSIDLRRGRSCVFLVHVHLVFVTKYRRTVFTNESLSALKAIFLSTCRKMGIELVECNGEKDHVHLLLNYPPKMSISKIVNALKGASSRRIRKMDFVDIQEGLWGNQLWSPSYFAGSCGGAPLVKIREYIENQKSP